jgi:uncharacterized protein
MQDNIKEQIAILVNLQRIETETDEIKSNLDDVSKKFDKLDAGIVAFEQTLKDEESFISELKKKYRDFESDLQTNISRVKKSREKLSSIKNNREYQSFLKEIEDLKVKISKIEDEMIECLELTETAEKNISSEKSELMRLVDRVNLEKEKIKQEVAEGKEKLVRLEVDWKKMSGIVKPELLKTFVRVKETQTGKFAIVPVKDAVCRGCNMNIPPQMYNELYLGDTLRFCPNCQRIIYLENQSDGLESRLGSSSPNDRRTDGYPEESPNTKGQDAP